jgi:hypothetical protein
MEESARVQAFGVWDAPMTDDAEWIEVPTDLACMYCGERFQRGDNGSVNALGFAGHRECSLRSAMGGIGHLVDHARYCRSELGPDAGLTYRQSARMVWRYVSEGARITVDDLEALR